MCVCVCVFVECSAYVKRSLCFQEIPSRKHLNLLRESVGHPWKLKPIKSWNPHFKSHENDASPLDPKAY